MRNIWANIVNKTRPARMFLRRGWLQIRAAAILAAPHVFPVIGRLLHMVLVVPVVWFFNTVVLGAFRTVRHYMDQWVRRHALVIASILLLLLASATGVLGEFIHSGTFSFLLEWIIAMVLIWYAFQMLIGRWPKSRRRRKKGRR